MERTRSGDGIVVLRLARPEVRNALDTQALVELLGDVRPRAQRALARRRQHEHPDRLVGGELGQRSEQGVEQGRVHRVANLRAVEPEDRQPVVLGTLEGWHAPPC